MLTGRIPIEAGSVEVAALGKWGVKVLQSVNGVTVGVQEIGEWIENEGNAKNPHGVQH